eukprot:m.111273 g.111273  ORF g.111273 m.111273 type:complete len:218 (-) comp28108_c0_seq2:259-912(-)
MLVQVFRRVCQLIPNQPIHVRWSSSTLAPTITQHAPVLLLGAPELTMHCKECADDPLLHEKATLVATLEHFRKTKGFGRGIAAPQIGVLRRFIAINLGDGPQVLTDPTIIEASAETMTLYDDCMSLPWLLCKVERHASISIEFFDEACEKVRWENLPPDVSELLQHEIDHLDGVLLLDRAVGGSAAAACVSREVYQNKRAHFDRQVTYAITPTISTD